MPLPVALINQTPNEIGIVDLGIFVPPGSGTILDLTGLYLIEEVRDSSDLQEQTVVSGSIVISGSEGVISSAAAARFFTGSQIAEQNFTTEGVDLRSLRNIIIVEGDNIVVTSGEAPNQTLVFTITTAPNVVTDAIVGSAFVTVTSGTNEIVLATDNTNPAFSQFIQGQSPAIVGSGIVTVTSGIDTITVAADAADQDVHHFSFEIIASGIEKEVPFTHQMALHGELVVESTGSLLVEGTVVLEI